LKESLLKIALKMKAKKKSWEKCLCETIEEYKDTYEQYMKRYYAYLIA